MTKICVIASTSHEAYHWAKSQNLEDDQWFYPRDTNDLLFKNNFHTVVIGLAGLHNPQFEKLYSLALSRGKIGRI
jgi:hypothetical protein